MFYYVRMIARAAARIVRERLAAYPAVALVGPRQAGKTTLARQIGGRYFDLEQEGERLRLDLEWPVLERSNRLVILDEAQSMPQAFSRLRSAIDVDRKRKGRYLLLGSVSPALMKQVAESLAGRLSVVELTPFLLDELPRAALDRLWLLGGYPDGGILAPARAATPFPQWQRDYLTLLAQRDLPNWGMPARPALTQRLLKMTAAVHGQVLNASQLGNSLGITYHTVIGYLDYLTGAFLHRVLPPYQANLAKRLSKRPKLYWRDSGLLHALLNVSSRSALLDQPWVGASWEGFAIEQILGCLAHRGMAAEPFYFRTSDGYEADLVLELSGELWAIEVKLSTVAKPQDMAHLERVADFIGARRCILVSRTGQAHQDGRRVSCGLPWLIDHLGELVKG